MKMKVQMPSLVVFLFAAFIPVTTATVSVRTHGNANTKQPAEIPGIDDSLEENESMEADAEEDEGSDDETENAEVATPHRHRVRAAPQHHRVRAVPKPHASRKVVVEVVAPQHHPVAKHHKVAPKHLRTPAKVQAQVSGKSLSSLQQNLKKEHRLRLSAEGLVKKLTNV